MLILQVHASGFRNPCSCGCENIQVVRAPVIFTNHLSLLVSRPRSATHRIMDVFCKMAEVNVLKTRDSMFSRL